MHDVIRFFFFNDTATTEIYTLSLHDALPISVAAKLAVRGEKDLLEQVFRLGLVAQHPARDTVQPARMGPVNRLDRKSTRLNSSHANISYAVFCLKKKKQNSRRSPHSS